MRMLVSLLVLVGIAMAGCNQQAPGRGPGNASAADPAGHGGHGTPVARTTLLGNLGEYQRPITSSNPEARQFFDEGLTLLYGFNHEEAFRSFERAAALDAKAPMPHWGMSLALGTNYNDTATPDRLQQAYDHLTHAQARASAGSDVERAFIDALAKRYVATPNDGQQPAREAAYSAAMGEVSKRFPDDLDAATLYAESMMNLRPWKLYTFDGKPEPGTEQIVATLERVMARNPRHPGANHYHIHAVEASRTPERGVSERQAARDARPRRRSSGAHALAHLDSHRRLRRRRQDECRGRGAG